MINIKSIVDQEIESINKSIEHAKEQRDEAATPTESTHDQTRQHADQLVQALKQSKVDLLAIKAKILRSTTLQNSTIADSLIEIENLNTKHVTKYLIVPEGLGGRVVEGITLLGEQAPLAKIIIRQKTGFVYEINGTKYTIKNLTFIPQ